MNITKINIKLSGIRPLMFDRYPGDNNTNLPIAEKMYLDNNLRLCIPTVNLYSLLSAENTKSVCRQFFGKNGKTIGLGINSYTYIDAITIPLTDDDGNVIVFDKFGEPGKSRFWVDKRDARLKNGVPNHKERPVLNLPWNLEFTMFYSENELCTLENLRQAFHMGGILGIGTFRPMFGRYELTSFEV